MKGIVIRSTGSWYDIRIEKGDTIQARIRGKLRLDDSKFTNPVAVGDIAILRPDENGDFMIDDIEERKNYIVRQSPKHHTAKHILAANIDQAILVVTISKPRTSTGFMDRFIVTAEAYHIPTHIVFNKQDLLTEKEKSKQEEYIKIYEQLGYPLYFTNATERKGLEAIHSLLEGKITLLSGHSGVGKSTLMNAVAPGLKLRTGEISTKHEKGMHTTTFAEMIALPFGGYVIDTPGIKEFGVLDIELAEISHYFSEMRSLIGKCQFNNCLHEMEPGCAVHEALQKEKIHPERYNNYLNILDDVREKKPVYTRR